MKEVLYLPILMMLQKLSMFFSFSILFFIIIINSLRWIYDEEDGQFDNWDPMDQDAGTCL